MHYLTEGELCLLQVKKGNLTEKERATIEEHAIYTNLILSGIQFPDNLKNIPEYASLHHESLNGTGYPDGRTADEIPLQSRIIAVADIFEALTAKDRPYRKVSLPKEEVLKILNIFAKDNILDNDIIKLFEKE
jgi:HD-GYP domain-containing protein (c-di-GMP phosphodiesterase class II)